MKIGDKVRLNEAGKKITGSASFSGIATIIDISTNFAQEAVFKLDIYPTIFYWHGFLEVVKEKSKRKLPEWW